MVMKMEMVGMLFFDGYLSNLLVNSESDVRTLNGERWGLCVIYTLIL